MKVTVQIELETADAGLVADLASYIGASRKVMVDPGGDERGMIGTIVGVAAEKLRGET